MSINLQKRITTGPKTAFVSCTQLPVREDIISKQAMVSYNGGNGRGGGSRSSAGRVAQVVGEGIYNANDGGVTRRMVQTMEAAVLQSGSRNSNEPSWVDDAQNAVNSLRQTWDNAVREVKEIPDELGDAASECLEDGVNYMITGMALMGRR